ncbi:MAG: dTMP kinase [Rhodococcus sp.]|nr:dTMP kinase [Rhodococcus sp. (in: high G+C Gram-positive bacteria)]
MSRGILVALEGLDGAGKRTLVAKVLTHLDAAGVRTATLDFPRYGRSLHADIASEALSGAHGDLAESVHAMAVMFAFDRGGAAEELRELLDTNDVVILDRYVASNAAYGAARLHQDAAGEFVKWIDDLEYGRFALPVPDMQWYLEVPVTLAESRARNREANEGRVLDAYERDSDLQTRTAAVYTELAARQWKSPWTVLGADSDPSVIAHEIVSLRQ